jgi:hypothetical protein
MQRPTLPTDSTLTPPREPRERGFALVMVFGILIPAVLLVAALSSVLNSRNDELQQERALERALHAAESGIDLAIFRGRRGLLTHNQTYTHYFAPTTSYRVVATHLLVDGQDNDGDALIDAADDNEDVFQVEVVGQYRNVTRRLAAYLGPMPLLPDVRTALGIANPGINLQLGGSCSLSGMDHSGSYDVPGLTIFAPGTVADLNTTLTPAEQGRINGPGGPPSVGTIPAINLVDLVSIIQNVADLVLTSASYSGLLFGDAVTNDPRITYRAGNLRLAGNSRGAGILVVTGNLEVLGNFEFTGLIVVLGNIVNSSGSALIRGAMLQGPTATTVDLTGNFDLQFSSDALGLANSKTGLYVAFNGWQELQR